MKEKSKVINDFKNNLENRLVDLLKVTRRKGRVIKDKKSVEHIVIGENSIQSEGNICITIERIQICIRNKKRGNRK